MAELLVILQIVRDATLGLGVAREIVGQIVELCAAGRASDALSVALAYKREAAAHKAADEAAKAAGRHV